MPHPPADILRYQQMIEQRKPLAPFYAAAPEANPKTWEISNLAHQMSQPQNILYPGQPVELPQMRKSYGSPGYQWDYQPLYEQNKDPYVPVNTFHEQNINPYERTYKNIIFSYIHILICIIFIYYISPLLYKISDGCMLQTYVFRTATYIQSQRFKRYRK